MRNLVPIAEEPPSPAAISRLFLHPCHTSLIGVNASFTGIGPVGNHAARGLRQVFGHANARRRSQGLNSSTFAFCSTERRKPLPPGMIEEQHMAFLVGSTGDPRFWHAREIILSSSPHFLLTLGTLENNQEAATTSLIENEGFLLLRPPVDFLRVSQLILHLLSVLASTNFISVDLSDLVTVLGGAHLEWSVYQTAMSKDLRGYASFLEDSVERIRESKLVFALVCFDDPRSTFLSDVDRALEPLDRLVRDDAAIVFLTDWTAFDEVAFEVHLVVIEKANSPSKPGQLPRVI